MINFHLTQFVSNKNLFLLAAVAIAALASSADAQHSDALLVSVGGQVVVGTASDIDGPNEQFALDAGVFELIMRAGFAPPLPADYETDEPGFFALHGTADAAALAALGAEPLPGGAQVSAELTSFNVGGADSLFYWNGSGAVDFQSAADALPAVQFGFSPVAFGTTDANGALDGHPIYQLNLAGAAKPADGVYLVAPRIGVAGLDPSDPFYAVVLVDALITGEDQLELVEHALDELEAGGPDALVDFGGGVTKDFAFYEAAVEWVESNLVVPEPAALSLALFASVVGTHIGRRRRGLNNQLRVQR
jgi:hypothetical protein